MIHINIMLPCSVSMDETEKLRHALRTLSESEKQLRVSNDKITWLTAALLQLAPDQQYMLPISSPDNSFSSPMAMNVTNESDETLNNVNRSLHHSAETRQANQCNQNKYFMDVDKIWIAVIENIQINALKHFMQQEARLSSISFEAGWQFTLLINFDAMTLHFDRNYLINLCYKQILLCS